MRKVLIYILVMISVPNYLFAQKKTYHISGKVVRSISKEVLPGATVQIKGSGKGTKSAEDGSFNLSTELAEGFITVSYIGLKSKEVAFSLKQDIELVIALDPAENMMTEVLVSTGYQQIPRERATGSFVKIENALVNRRVSTDILSRLEDVTSGLQFNKGVQANNATTGITIRGQSTINANADPLIVVDNFPYDGNLNNINPNDVESVTVLKDAAAASIWGARAGNGVIVITTKKGSYNKPVQVSFNSNVTIGNKPDPFYTSQMSTADFIDIEKKLFTQGFYEGTEQGYGYPPLTPVIELLVAKRDGILSATEADDQVKALKTQDVRNDIRKFLYRKSVNQQYALSLNGGTANQRYFISAGYDKNLDNLVRNGYDRVTFNGNNSWSFLNKKLELGAGFNFTQSKTNQNNAGLSLLTYGPYSNSIYPYARLVDDAGNPAAITKDFRETFIASAPQAGLLDWNYRPLQEVRVADNYYTIFDTRLFTNLNYKIISGLSASLLYQYQKSLTDGHNLQNLQSYYTRNLINTYTYVDPDGKLGYALPIGSILDQSSANLYSHNVRAQLNYDKEWGVSNLTGIAGYEIKTTNTNGNINRLYGYDENHGTSKPVDLVNAYYMYPYPGYATQIPSLSQQSGLTDHFRSYFANGAYTYNNRYVLSASARIDQSNLFGVKTNQKGVPLWSSGVAWNVANENFYKLSWLPLLRLRATFGYNGNVAKNLSAYTTAHYSSLGASDTNLPYLTVVNPPNPQLRWERIQSSNVGVDFSIKNDILSGTLEYYHKKGMDLIGTIPFAPSTGISLFTGNSANTVGHGFDLNLNSRNIDGKFKWLTNFLFSYQIDKVTSYASPASVSTYIGNIGYPIVGKPLYSIYSYRWAGLDPQTGDPQGYLNDEISKNYNAIINQATKDDIIFNGSARPTTFGSFRNTFSWNDFSLSANITYRLNYYFRKNSVNYNYILSGLGGSGDYEIRWQNPGDEQRTIVPSGPNAIDQNRDSFYMLSQALVGKADNIRLQDVTLSYNFTRQAWKKLPFKNLQLYAYGNNLMMIWKANHFNIDPDYQSGPPPRTFALGLKMDF